jgi:adenylate cyclase
VIEKVIADGTADVGVEKEVTALFADLVDFAAISEGRQPSVVVRILNGYFESMSQAITRHRGHVSPFEGDGILAVFGSTTPNPWQGDDAVHAALDMLRAITAYNEELTADGFPELTLGIGLQRGTGVGELVGNQQLKEFTFTGDTVNVAARVQDLTQVLSAEIIVAQTLRDSLDPRFQLRALPDTTVEGIEKPIVIYAVDGFDEDGNEA